VSTAEDARRELGSLVTTLVLCAGLTIHSGMSWWWWLGAFAAGTAVNFLLHGAVEIYVWSRHQKRLKGAREQLKKQMQQHGMSEQ
jgi:cell division protein FtsW (lipid II flippase)